MYKRQILVIDNEKNRCEVFMNALGKMPNMFKCSFSGNTGNTDKAIKYVKNLKPDFIFINMPIPDINDLVCLKAIKKEKTIQHIPLFVYTPKLDDTINRKANELGALKIIRKPKNTKTLVRVLKRLFYESIRAEVRNYAPR